MQLLLALSVAFIVAFTLLGYTAVRLGDRSRNAARVTDAEAAGHTISVGVSSAPQGSRHRVFTQLADAALGHGGIRGVEWARGADAPAPTWVRGITGLGTPVEVDVESGGVLRLWVRAPEQSPGPFNQLMLMYVAITGGMILLLTYLVLTVLIVRPVEALTMASSRIAGGNLEVEAPVRGAKEIARLSHSFNLMAKQVRSDRGALETQLHELEAATAELSAAQDQVLRSTRLASVGRLAAGVAHEIGNPLAAILGLIELARDEDLDPETRDEFLARIQKETERINGIIRDLLDFARDGAESDGNDETADLAAVVADAVQLVAPQKDASKLRIERRVSPVAPVRGNADRLTQVLLNLLLNAADAMDGEGDIVIEVDTHDEETALLTVTDSGPGIPESIRDQLFEPFVTSKAVGQGTGLGLAVTFTIVDRLGGSIEASNPEGGGARFVVRLPLAS